jgi:hypothetical protein
MSDNPVTSVMVRESFMFAQLSASGHDTNEVGTAFTAAKSRAFDVWLESVQDQAYKAGAEDALEEADMNMRMVGY